MELTFELFGHEACSLCDRLEAMIAPHLKKLRDTGYEATLIKHNIKDNRAWLHAYRDRIPVLILDGDPLLQGRPGEDDVQSAFDRLARAGS